MKTYRAWIIEAPKTGQSASRRFTYLAESALFPGTHNRLSNNKSWASRASAIASAKRNGLVVEQGECPLPRTSQEQVADYHRRAGMRRDAFAVWGNDPISLRMRAEDREEAELNDHIAAMRLRNPSTTVHYGA